MKNRYVQVFFFANGVPAQGIAQELAHDRRVLAVVPCEHLDAACIVARPDVDIDAFEVTYGGIAAVTENEMQRLLSGEG